MLMGLWLGAVEVIAVGRLCCAKLCSCWLYLACVPVLVYLALSCMSAVVIHIVAVCVRMNKVDYYSYYYYHHQLNVTAQFLRCINRNG